METVGPIIALALLAAAFLFLYVAPVAWAIRDAQTRGVSGGYVYVLFLLFGPLAALVWLLSRPSTQIAQRPIKTYDNADDALDAASKLDQLGEWDAAIELYDTTASRWPEHRDYALACIAAIKKKQGIV